MLVIPKSYISKLGSCINDKMKGYCLFFFTAGLSTLKEVETGIQHIIADVISKDKDTMDKIREL